MKQCIILISKILKGLEELAKSFEDKTDPQYIGVKRSIIVIKQILKEFLWKY